MEFNKLRQMQQQLEELQKKCDEWEDKYHDMSQTRDLVEYWCLSWQIRCNMAERRLRQYERVDPDPPKLKHMTEDDEDRMERLGIKSNGLSVAGGEKDFEKRECGPDGLLLPWVRELLAAEGVTRIG